MWASSEEKGLLVGMLRDMQGSVVCGAACGLCINLHSTLCILWTV